MNWYVLYVYSGSEGKVVELIKETIKKHKLEEKITEVISPSTDVQYLRFGKKVQVKKNMLPGYVLIKMDINEDIVHLLLDLPKVSSFVGGVSLDTKLPQSISQKEVDAMMGNISQKSSSSQGLINLYSVGENVYISSGAFATFEGIIQEVDESKNKLIVEVTIFGRATPVELDVDQVKKVDE